MTVENNDEISLRDILIKISLWVYYVLSKWYIILLAGIIGGAIGYVNAVSTKPIYTGKLTFFLSTESKGGGLSGLASQFGFDVGGGSSGNDVFSGDNILTLFKSKKMIKSVLFKKPPYKDDILANIIVKEWKWDKAWNKNERTKDLFPFPQDTAALKPIQDSLIREVYNAVTGNYLSVSRPDKKLSLFVLSTTSTNELFACYLTRFLMDATAKFYIDAKTSVALQNFRMIQRDADSIRGLLSGAISSTASEGERTFNLNPALLSQRAPAQKSQVRATVLATAYGEILKNLEIAKINLQREKPLYQIIDEPELPLIIN
ncbi:MAG: lipopolysaccharide biosynthesis protein, partial [Chitinophagaceae bacterium]|nr:lipopolysaccharide biosynthesis protein [Chitinophagaceae bacterium]